jgi:flagellar biosynthesis/type III secretory pathway M-ring protein FliF/YscJ
MKPLITEAKASGLTRVVDDTLQTFTPVSKAADGPVAIVQVDRPLEVVETQTGDLWSMVRLGSALGLVVSLLFLGLTFVPSRRRVRAREHEERPEQGERQDGDAGAETNAEGQPKEPPIEASAPTYEEVFGLQHELDQTVEQDGDLEGDPEALEADPEAREPDPVALESIRRWDEEYHDKVHEELQTQELMRQRREEFKARAEAAALRVKKLEAEPHEAPPTPD